VAAAATLVAGSPEQQWHFLRVLLFIAEKAFSATELIAL
jgi:hypothetical protein